MKASTFAGSRASDISLGTALLASLLPLVLSWAIAAFVFGFRFAFTGMIADAIISVFAVISLSLFVRTRLALWALGCLISFLPLANAIKIGFLGAPLLAGDAAALWTLIRVLPGWRHVVAMLGLFLFVVPLAWALRPRKGCWRGVVAISVVSLAVVAAGAYLSQRAAKDAKNNGRIEQLRTLGAHLHLSISANEMLRSGLRQEGKEDVKNAIAGLGIDKAKQPGNFERRNIHLILLESVWDPLVLGHYQFSRDPFDPRFRKLLESVRSPSAMVPTFGGATANAEFEILCGLPASDESVVFRDALDNSLPCLPRLLRDAGYRTVASHPFKQDYWSRNNAYPRVGFEYYEPDAAFDLDDMDGSFLNDASTFKQVRQALATNDDRRPLFQYVVSLSSHYPYSRNRKVRPDLVTVEPKASLLEDYANAIAYTTKAFMDHVEAIRASDPEALIIAVGDHAPVLGPNPDPYARSGLSLSNTEDRARAIPVVSRTPLLMLDGSRGAVDLGEVPLRALPTLILKQLGEHAPRLPYGANPLDESLRWDSRSFQNEFLVKKNGAWIACARENVAGLAADCARANKVRSWLMTMRKDISQGKQYALNELNAPLVVADTVMKIESRYDACGLTIRDWGPRSMAMGEPFNVQLSGRSAFWFSLENGRGEPELVANRGKHPILIAGKSASAGVDATSLFSKPGTYPLEWICADGSTGKIGSFLVTGNPAVVENSSAKDGKVDLKECSLEVKDWGPREVTMGNAFNRQPDGLDAVWMTVGQRMGHPELVIGGKRSAGVFSGTSASLSIDAAGVFTKPGEYPLDWVCGTTKGHIGIQ